MPHNRIPIGASPHYIDKNLNPDADNLVNPSGTGQTPAVSYVRLGQDLEAFAEELNPQVEVKKNILGEQTVNHNGYEVQSTADPFYCYYGDTLFTHLASVANGRKTGADCQTTRVDVLLAEDGTVLWAYRENCWVVPQSVGGDTSGVQIPFAIMNCGGRVSGTWNTSTKTFTPATTSSSSSSGTGSSANTGT